MSVKLYSKLKKMIKTLHDKIEEIDGKLNEVYIDFEENSGEPS